MDWRAFAQAAGRRHRYRVCLLGSLIAVADRGGGRPPWGRIAGCLPAGRRRLSLIPCPRTSPRWSSSRRCWSSRRPRSMSVCTASPTRWSSPAPCWHWRPTPPCRQGAGFLFSLTGLAAGLALFLPFYALHAMGAGDMKLLGMAARGWERLASCRQRCSRCSRAACSRSRWRCATGPWDVRSPMCDDGFHRVAARGWRRGLRGASEHCRAPALRRGDRRGHAGAPRAGARRSAAHVARR